MPFYALVAASCLHFAGALTDDADLPRWRRYDVRHPVYSANHPVWSLERGTADPDQWVGKSNDTLHAHIDEQGARRGDNARMLTVLHYLAHRYAQTRDPKYAYKCAVILERYAEVIGAWPFTSRTWARGRSGPLRWSLRKMPPRWRSCSKSS